MSVWCCAAILFGGGDPPLELPPTPNEPVLMAKKPSLLTPSEPCTDCGGKVLPRQPIARQALPPMTAPENSIPLGATVRSAGPVDVDMSRSQRVASYERPPMYAAPYEPRVAYEPRNAVYGRGLDPNPIVQAPPKAPWWKRLFGRGSEQPTWQMANDPSATMSSAPTMTVANPTPNAGRPMRRETWRTPEPVSPPMPAPQVVSSPAVEPQMAPSPEFIERSPVRAAEREVHTVRKPQSSTTMLRDASVWEYSKPWDYPERSHGAAAKATKPAMTEELVPIPTDARVANAKPLPPRQDWQQGLAGKAFDRPTPRERIQATSEQRMSVEDGGNTETHVGRVSWTYAAGGCWVLNTGRMQHVLRGDPSVLRLKNGDVVEIQGVVKREGALGMTSIMVEKLSLSAKR